MTRSQRPGTAEREAAFRAFFTATHPDLLRFVQRRVHPSHADDVVADVFLVAWRRYDEAPPGLDRQRAWAFGIARNCLLNTRRGIDRQEALAVHLAHAVPTPSPPGADPESVVARVDLAAAWRELDAADQETLALSALDGLTAPEAGRVLGISSVAYRLRLMRARTTLRRHLDRRSTSTPTDPSEASHERA